MASLLKLREQRIPPGRDDKVLADWNGLMIAALARASAVFDEPNWLTLAEKAFAFITTTMQQDDRLAHSFRDGRTLDLGFVEDYAAMADGALALFQATQQQVYLDQVVAWVQTLDEHHGDAEQGGYFQTPGGANDVLIRPKTAEDGPAPSGNGQLVSVLARLADLSGENRYRDRANDVIRCFAGDTRKNPLSHTSLLSGLTMLAYPIQIVLVHGPGSEGDNWLQAALAAAPPGATVLKITPDTSLPADHPAQGKGQIGGRPTAYVCEGMTCRPPITDQRMLIQSFR